MPKKMFSVRLDEDLVREVGKSAGIPTASETIQRALERLRDEQREARFWRRWGGRGGPAAFRALDDRRS